MAAIPRQTLTDAIDPEELADDARMESFQRARAWLFLSVIQNDLIQLTPALATQLRAMFPRRDWPNTRANIETILGG